MERLVSVLLLLLQAVFYLYGPTSTECCTTGIFLLKCVFAAVNIWLGRARWGAVDGSLTSCIGVDLRSGRGDWDLSANEPVPYFPYPFDHI